MDNGYIENNNYYFYVRDHLGNNRVVVSASDSVVQSNEYYPFGMLMSSSTDAQKQPYKYNGKELETGFDLNWYDYSARYYDGIRFTTVDPKAEKYYSLSPYVYVANNPIKYLDPDGREKLNGMGPRGGGDQIAKRRATVDNGMIHIYAHGSVRGMQFIDNNGGETEVRNAQDLRNLLSRYSAIYNNRMEGEELIIVLHSCNTGKERDDTKLSFAYELSLDMPGVIIVAPAGLVDLSTIDEVVYDVVRYNGRRVKSVRNWLYYKDGLLKKSVLGHHFNNPDREDYSRSSESKGNTKEEQANQYSKGMEEKKDQDYRESWWGTVRTWFYDKFGI